MEQEMNQEMVDAAKFGVGPMHNDDGFENEHGKVLRPGEVVRAGIRRASLVAVGAMHIANTTVRCQ
jgi:hypothetical protein